MATPENTVKKKLEKILKYIQAYYFFPATHGYGRSGVPDVVGCYDGIFFAIECKAEGKEPTALQEYELRQIVKQHGVAFVYDGTMPDAEVIHRIIGSKS